LAAGKMRKNELVTNGFRYDFTESQAASCKQFQSQNRRFRVFEAVYLKTLSLIILSTKKQKIVKTIGACTEIPVYNYKPSKIFIS
jgi:hypothetical protein